MVESLKIKMLHNDWKYWLAARVMGFIFFFIIIDGEFRNLNIGGIYSRCDEFESGGLHKQGAFINFK
jgi:hypothetical protein